MGMVGHAHSCDRTAKLEGCGLLHSRAGSRVRLGESGMMDRPEEPGEKHDAYKPG